MSIDLLSRIFRFLIVFNFLASFIFIFFDMNLFIESQYDLSPLLEESNVSIIEGMGTFGLVFILLWIIAAYFLVFFYIKWSREIYVIITLLFFLIELIDGNLGGYLLLSKIENLLYTIQTLLEGIIIALAYFSPLRDKFKNDN